MKSHAWLIRRSRIQGFARLLCIETLRSIVSRLAGYKYSNSERQVNQRRHRPPCRRFKKISSAVNLHEHRKGSRLSLSFYLRSDPSTIRPKIPKISTQVQNSFQEFLRNIARKIWSLPMRPKLTSASVVFILSHARKQETTLSFLPGFVSGWDVLRQLIVFERINKGMSFPICLRARISRTLRTMNKGQLDNHRGERLRLTGNSRLTVKLIPKLQQER